MDKNDLKQLGYPTFNRLSKIRFDSPNFNAPKCFHFFCLDTQLVLFWPIGSLFSKGKYEKYTFYEIRLENTRNTNGVHYHERRVRGFRGYRTLWGSGRPTLRKIALTSCAIWGKYTFLRNTEIWFENTKNQGAPSQTLCSEVFVAIGHYGVAVVQPCAISIR